MYQLQVQLKSYLFYNLQMHRGEYRIRGQKKTEDDFDQEIEEQLKLSTHAKGQKRESSAMLSRKHQESSQNSRLADSRANSRIGSSVIGSRVGRVLRNSRTDKNRVVDIEFNNVRWISIVSAYDSKRLKNVTVSKQSCQTFLKRYGTGIKNDAAAMALFKDIKKHFHSWLGRINEAFSDVIDDFLRVSERAPLQNFKKMEPILESISKDTNMMGQKLEGCLKIYENNDFRKLFTRFQNFNQFSNKLQDLIKGIYQSKHRIDELFSQLQNNEDQNVVDKKVDKIIKKGVRQAEHIIDQVNGYNTSIRDRIISKVRLAINDMAEKSLSLFHKVQGAKDLIRRLHKLITDSRRNLESSQIRKISKILKAVIEQANKFQDFVMNFNAEEDHISPKLRQKLQQYSESIEQQKRAVCEIQILFVQTVISQAIQTLKGNFTLNYVLSPNQHKVQYSEFNHTLQQISDAMLDQTSRGSVEGLIKHGKSNFSKLDDELEKIKRTLRKNQGIIFIDTQNGEIEIMEYCNLVDKYKTKIKNLISKHEQALRSLRIPFRQSRLSDSQKDHELIYLKDLRKIVEMVNGKQRIDNISRLKGLTELKNSGNILTYGTQAVQVYNLMQEMNNNKKQASNFTQSNLLKNLIRDVRFENQLYIQSAFVLQSYEIINKTTDKNLIQNLTKLTQINSKRNNQLQHIDGYKTTKDYSHLLDRLYCLCLIKGLKKTTVKQFDDNKAIIFPETEYDAKQMENELKYRTLISQTIGQGGTFSKNKIKAAIKVKKDMISSFRIIQKLNNNANGEFVILVESLSSYTSQYFKIIISTEDLNERGVQCKKITIQCIKSLKSKLSNIELIDQQVDMQTVDAALKARNRIISLQTLNQKALTALQQLSKKNDYLQIFSNYIFIVSEYIQQSKQIAYVALNQFKQPIWLGSIAAAKDGVIAEIDLKGYKRGTFVDQYTRQPPIVRKMVEQKQQKQKKGEFPNRSPITKQKKFIVREKSHQKQSMDEQMPIESDRQMDQKIENEVLQDYIQQINDDMVQEINDNIEEDNMDEQIDQIEDGVEQITDKMAEDIDQQVIESFSPNKSKTNPKEAPKQQLPPQKPKIQVKKESSVSVYQIIPHFRELQQIRNMFLLVDSTETAFWSNQVDYQQVEDFYHRVQDLKDRTNFIKSLQSCFSIFINSRFQKGIAQEIKRLDRFVSLKQKFNNLGQKSWIVLFKVLSSIDFSYCLLLANKSQKQQIIQVKISGKGVSNFKKQGPKHIIQNFLERTFKSSFFKADKFDLQDFLSNCFKVDVQQSMNTSGDGLHYIIKVIPQYKQSLPQGETHSLLQSLEKHEDIFSKNLVTGIDFRALLIQFWIKAISSESEDYYKPDYSTLNKYIKSLDYVEKKQWIGYYLIDFRQNILKIRDKIKSHKNLIDNTLFKIDSSNIWQCINNICELYQKNIKERTVYVNSKQQQVILYAICEDSAIGVTSQSRLSTFLQDLFNRSDKKQSKVIISNQQIINTIEKQFQKDQTAFQMHDSITNLLNIIEIQHFYAVEPQIILKSSIDQVVFTILKNLNIKTKAQIQYQQIFKDLFENKRNNFSNFLSLKKKIDKKILTQAHIKEINNRIKEISKQSKKNEQNFKNAIINCQMSSIILDYLSNKPTNNAAEAIKQYYNGLKQIQQQLKSRLTSKSFNLLYYVFQKKKQIVELEQANNKNLLQVEKLTKSPRQSGEIMKIVDQTSLFIKNLSQYMSDKGFASNLTQFSIVADNNSWVFGLQFSKMNPQQYLKQFFSRHLLPKSDNKKQIQTLCGQFYKKYIQNKTTINKNGNITQISYQISKVLSQFIGQIRQDLIHIDDMLLFTRYYNQHRFNTNTSILKKLEQVHTKIVNSIKSKLFLVQIKEVIKKCNWNGLQKLQPFKDLFQSFTNELTYQKDYLSTLIQKTEQIGVQQTDLKAYIQWFKQSGINQLKMQYYLVKSSQKNIITILPVAKIQKDKSKSSEEINNFLSEIKLVPKYTLALQHGVSTITLQRQIVKCRLADSQNFLYNQSQLDGFKPSIPDGEILLLSLYQGTVESQKIPLTIGQMKIVTQCVLNITQYETFSAITCSIWKIAKQDYDSWKTANQNPNQQSFKQLRKKMRGLATTQQKVKDVCVGQEVNFNEIGTWLRQQLKKHLRSVQKQQQARKERQRIQRLTIQQSEQFLETIQNEMLNKESLPTVKVTFNQVKKFKSEDVAQPSSELKGYCKKVLESNKKIIEKIEQSKSSEEMNRISTLTKDYLKIVKIKLTENQQIQEQLIKSAKVEFSVIERQRETKQQQKRKERLLKTKLKQQKQQEQLRKKLSAEAAKIRQGQTNTLNVASNQNIPSLEAKKAPQTQQQQVQESQQQQQPKVEQEQIDECELILECAEFEKIKKGKQQELYMSYLIFLLEGQSRKDVEYYRCILKSFWKQTQKNRESLVLMK